MLFILSGYIVIWKPFLKKVAARIEIIYGICSAFFLSVGIQGVLYELVSFLTSAHGLSEVLQKTLKFSNFEFRILYLYRFRKLQ